MAPPDTIWHKKSLKLKEIFGTREGVEICPHQLFPGPIKAPVGTRALICDGTVVGQWWWCTADGGRELEGGGGG